MLTKVRQVYLTSCRQNEVAPSSSLLTQLRDCIETKKPLSRVSITHGTCGDKHATALLSILALVPLTDIALNYVGLTDEGASNFLQTLSDRYAITSLELFGNQLGDDTCHFIPQLLRAQKLVRLKLGDNCITDIGASLVADGLVNQTSLLQLHLGGNRLGDAGLIAIVNALQHNSALTSLGIRDNHIGALGIQHLAEHLCRKDCVLSEVQLKGNVVGDEGAEYLAKALTCNGTLRVLEVQGNKLGPLGAAHLCRALQDNTTVHAVNFNDNALSDDGAKAIADLLRHNSSITTVGLSGNKVELQGTEAIADALIVNNTLTGLDLGNNSLGDAGVTTLAEVLRVRNTTLMSLDLHLNNVNLAGTVSLAAMLKENTTLRHLDFGSNFSRDPGAFAWASVISTSTTLTRLCLTDNEIGKKGGDALLTAIALNTTLRNFQFGGQSQTRPFANRIAPEKRKLINNVVSRNKRAYEAEQARLHSSAAAQNNLAWPSGPDHERVQPNRSRPGRAMPARPKPKSEVPSHISAPGRGFWDEPRFQEAHPWQAQGSPQAGYNRRDFGVALLGAVPDYPNYSSARPPFQPVREGPEIGSSVPVPTFPSFSNNYPIFSSPPGPQAGGWSPLGLRNNGDAGDSLNTTPSHPSPVGSSEDVSSETSSYAEHFPSECSLLAAAAQSDPWPLDTHALKTMLATLRSLGSDATTPDLYLEPAFVH